MFDNYCEYSIRLAGYKMKMLIEALEVYDSESPSFELHALMKEIENAEKVKIEV